MRPREKTSTAFNRAQGSPGNPLAATEIFRSVLDGFPSAILVVDPDFRILMGNEKAQQLLVTEDLAGKSVFDYLGLDQSERLPQAVAKCLEEGSATVECALLCASGARFGSVWRLSPILGPDTKPRAFVFRLEKKRESGRP